MVEIVVDAVEPEGQDGPVRCPNCGRENERMRYCRHVRWTFDQGGPIEFARFALETSPYTRARGYSTPDVDKALVADNADWIVDQVMLHFDAGDGYVFGELGNLDNFARIVWNHLHPEPERSPLLRH